MSVERNGVPVVVPFTVRIAEHPNTRAAIAEAKARAEEVMDVAGCRVLENVDVVTYYRLLKTVDRTVKLPRTITSKHGVVLTLSSDGKKYRGTAIGAAPVYDIEIDVSRPGDHYEAVAKRNGVTVEHGKGWNENPPEERLEIALERLESGLLRFTDDLHNHSKPVVSRSAKGRSAKVSKNRRR